MPRFSVSERILHCQALDDLTVSKILGIENGRAAMQCCLHDQAIPERQFVAPHCPDRTEDESRIDLHYGKHGEVSDRLGGLLMRERLRKLSRNRHEELLQDLSAEKDQARSHRFRQ